MRIVIYEYCCSGGTQSATLAAEGRAMFLSLLADAERDGEAEVVALVAEHLPLDLPGSVRRVDVAAGRDAETLLAEATQADATLIVAPETDGILAQRIAAVRAAGAEAIAPGATFIEIASDKQATAVALAAAGVPVPAGRSLVPGEPWPAGFIRPAVRKLRGSTSCDGLLLVAPHDEEPRPATRPTRLEAFAAGTPVGVSCLCGPRGILTLAPMRQEFASDHGGYIGGEPLVDPTAGLRAETLARRAIMAVAHAAGDPTPRGWIGVDMILGDRADGRDDRVLEVNPRITTSFVGHAAGLSGSLVRAMLEAAAGSAPAIFAGGRPQPRSFRLSADADRSCGP
jgi:predicted ATP-grasp superfamily ATP-dependent carboligase